MPRSKLLEKVSSATLKFLVPITLEETYRIIVDEAVKLSEGKYGTILLKKGDTLDRVYASAPHFFRTKPRRKGFSYMAAKAKKPFSATCVELEGIRPELIKAGVKSFIFIPLSYQNKSVGLLTIQSLKVKSWDEEEIHLLKLVGSMASLAIRKAQLHDQMQNALMVRDQFISIAGHELKTPLTTINGYIQLLKKKLDKTSFDEMEWVNNLYKESLRLTKLVDNLLQANKIRAGKVEYTFVEHSLSKIIHRSINQFKYEFPQRQVRNFSFLKEEELDTIIGDERKLTQVFLSVLENAAKFSGQNMPITINLRGRKENYVVEIIDKGKGIESKNFKNLFELFHKGSDENTAQGLGLGLFFCKSILEKHHGKVRLKSELGKGTRVSILLPKSNYDWFPEPKK